MVRVIKVKLGGRTWVKAGKRTSLNGACWEWSQREAVRHGWDDPNE